MAQIHRQRIVDRQHDRTELFTEVNFMNIHKTRTFAKILLFQIAEEHYFQTEDKEVLLQNLQGKTKNSNIAEKRWLNRYTISGQNKSDIFSSESQKGQQKHHGFFYHLT